MKVLKAINNNVVSCVDANGRELVVMGRGLGFHVKPGDSLEPSVAEKIFRMDSQEEVHRLKDLFAMLPPELLEVCNQIIDYAKGAICRQLNESVYLTLTDHIRFALNRSSQGISMPNPLLTEVKVFYPTEFTVGQYALERIREKMGVALAPDEAASIALHLVNAEYDSSMNATMHAAQVLRPVVDLMSSWPSLMLNREHLYYDELLVHLKFLAMQTSARAEGEWVSPKLAQAVEDAFPAEFACAGAVISYISEKCGNPIPGSEQAYLAICIHRACTA